MDAFAVDEARQRVARWIEDGQSVLGVVPWMFDEHERLRTALAAAEGDCARLRDELAALRAATNSLLSDRAEVAEMIAAGLNKVMNDALTRLRAPVGVARHGNHLLVKMIERPDEQRASVRRNEQKGLHHGRPVRRGSAEGRPLVEDPESFDADGVFRHAVALFDRGSFFEAHEFFERAWRLAPAPERAFFKGLTQLAVGLCHCQRGNARGALRLLTRGSSYLSSYPTPHLGVDVAALLAAMRTVATEIVTQAASPTVRFPRLPLA